MRPVCQEVKDTFTEKWSKSKEMQFIDQCLRNDRVKCRIEVQEEQSGLSVPAHKLGESRVDKSWYCIRHRPVLPDNHSCFSWALG
ncbi:unnamed protein product [Boreogadus saida]